MLAAGCTTFADSSLQATTQPEGASGYAEKAGWATRRYAIATANPLATDAGYQILKSGGSALDAAIAVQMVLTLVEPQSSGIGGGAFLLHWDGRQVEAYDGRETAPAGVDGTLFLAPDGKPLAFYAAVVGGRAVGTPGVVKMLEMAHREHGKLPWATLLQPAIDLAENGFKVSPRLHTLLAGETHLKTDPVARYYFYDPDGKPWPVGHLLKNPQLAAVLKRIGAEGSSALLTGGVARDIVAKVRNHPTNPGSLSEQDLAAYQPKKREAFCTLWLSYRVCGFPPPSSGAIAVAQILGMLEYQPHSDPPLENGLPSVDLLHRYTEASRLAFADRNQYVADPDFVPAPGGTWMSMVDPAYLRQRAALIGLRSMKTAQPGAPGLVNTAWAPQPEQIEQGTSHVSIIDAEGQSVAMTSSIESAFGSRQMVRGFLLNNHLSDFSFVPADATGKPIANRVEAGKRPRSSMSPTLVFDQATGRLLMSVGSPGGALIVHYTAKTLLGTLAWGLNVQEAINLPNFGSVNGPTLLEAKRFPATSVDALKARGHEIREIPMVSGLQAVQRMPASYFGGADPRREGEVMGE
ncbi:MAG: gamma-glutamyltransferase family protein [Proteobacteria bacterium]|nr:gamma-glutamyltransferase family protein [Pseudomonadota bacterium]